MIESLESAYEVRVNRRPVSAAEIGGAHAQMTVWTNDRDNADFLWLMHELGVKVVRAVPGDG